MNLLNSKPTAKRLPKILCYATERYKKHVFGLTMVRTKEKSISESLYLINRQSKGDKTCAPLGINRQLRAGYGNVKSVAFHSPSLFVRKKESKTKSTYKQPKTCVIRTEAALSKNHAAFRGRAIRDLRNDAALKIE